jgi:predicted ester cyclase
MQSNDSKHVVMRFNVGVIQEGRRDVFEALMAPDFINHSAPPGAPDGAEGMWHTFANVLRPAMSGLTVNIHEQLSEGDKVTTRKTINGVHTGELMGIPATGRSIAIDVIDIVKVRHGQYVAHWGVNTLPATLAHLRES